MDPKDMLRLLQKAIIVSPEKRNVGTNDRILSAIAGTLMGYFAVKNIKKGAGPLLLPASYLLWRATSGYCALYQLTGNDTSEGADPFMFSKSIYISRNRPEVYQYWRKFENLPKIMTHLTRVDKISNSKYHWEAEFNKQHFSWNAEIIDDIPNKRISWMSVDDSDVENGGSVQFMDTADGGTELKVNIIYNPAKTKIGRLAAKVFNPMFKQLVKDDLKEFQRRVEMEELIFESLN